MDTAEGAQPVPGDHRRVPPNDYSLRWLQSAIWAVVFMCTWLGVVGLLPGTGSEVADDLRERGSTVVTSEVRRHIDTGRGLYVADVEATFLVGGQSVTAQLQHVRDVRAGEEEIVPRDGPDWGSGPYEWWEEEDEIPPGSAYAPPLEVRYLPDEPAVAMAQVDLDALTTEGRPDPAAAFFFAPLAIALVVPPVRRVAFNRSRTT